MNSVNIKKVYSELSRKTEISELIYLIAFTLILSSAMLNTTMFRVYISTEVKLLIKAISCMLLLTKIFIIDKNTKKQLLLISLTEIIALIIWKVSGYSVLVDLSLLIIAAKNVSFKKIIKIYLYVVVIISILAMIAVKFGVIEHVIYYRYGKPRYSFGSIYCTDFAAHVFFAILAYTYLKKGILKFYHILIYIALGVFIYYFCSARLDSIGIFMVVIFCAYYNIKVKFMKDIENKSRFDLLKRIILISSVPVATIISIVTTMLYDSSNETMIFLNKILTRRLQYGKKGIEEFGFKLFGQDVPMQGNGATTEVVKNYFFIDCSYLNIALRYGLIVICAICLYYVILNYKLTKSGNYLLPTLILFVAINGLVAHHFLEIAYNPFLVCLFADLDS